MIIKRLYLYYDMKLVTFGIDNNKNLYNFQSLYSLTHSSHWYCVRYKQHQYHS